MVACVWRQWDDSYGPGEVFASEGAALERSRRKAPRALLTESSGWTPLLRGAKTAADLEPHLPAGWDVLALEFRVVWSGPHGGMMAALVRPVKA